MRSLIYVFNGRWPTEKAHGIQIAKMCEAFARAGLDVTLLVPYQRNVLNIDPFDFYALKNHFFVKRVWALDPEWIWEISQRAGNFARTVSALFGMAFAMQKCDIAYARDYASIILLSILGFRPVVEIHDYRLRKPNRLLKWALSHARTIVCNSEGTKSLLAMHYALCANVLIVPNGVDPDFFNIPETREQAREKLKLPQDKIIVGYVGRFDVAGSDKGVEQLKQAFEMLKNKNNSYLLIVGGPDLSVPYKDVPLYLRAIDIAVIPYPEERHAKTTSPIKYFEYLAAGKTIAVADDPDPKKLADKINDLIANPKHDQRGPLFTWEDRVKKILSASKSI